MATLLSALWVSVPVRADNGQPDEAQCTAPSAEASPPDAAQQAALTRIRNLTLAGDLSAAESLALSEKESTQAAGHAGIEVERARIAWLAGDLDAAQARLEAALTMQTDPSAWLGALEVLALDRNLRSPGNLNLAFSHGRQLLDREHEAGAQRSALRTGMARLYRWTGQHEVAVRWARSGLEAAQTHDAAHDEYRASTELAFALAEQGMRVAALQAFEISLHAFQRGRDAIVGEALHHPGGFRGGAGRGLLGYADLLLDAHADEDALWKALEVVETLKRSELDEFFLNRCDAERTATTSRALAERIPATELLLYPVVLPERSVMLRVQDGKIRQHAASSTASLDRDVRAFRQALEQGDATRIEELSRSLYRILLADEGAASTSTKLWIVADGVLRLLPWAALHDGERFLVERSAISTLPALIERTDAPDHAPTSAVFAGVSDAVQGFPALPGVAAEIETIRAGLDASEQDVLLNAAFETEALRAGLSRREPGVLHIATHGEIGARADQSFLLTYGGKLRLDQFDSLVRGLSGTPPQLIGLSACQTAAGDDRAALGLGGIAVQAGAQRVLATLWSVSDVATTRVMARFYRDYAQAPARSAEALRNAQLELLNQPATREPRFWAPYVLVERI